VPSSAACSTCAAAAPSARKRQGRRHGAGDSRQPLPGGGFVTSYADITSYKNAARELRSLADALEKRIAERTRDLDAAKQEAERANRYKTRFVPAAVHDLLQPLNAARMFTSLLPGHLHDEPAARWPQHRQAWPRRTPSSPACWTSRAWSPASSKSMCVTSR
jgi:signal transduction histidine kinase